MTSGYSGGPVEDERTIVVGAESCGGRSDAAAIWAMTGVCPLLWLERRNSAPAVADPV